MQRSGWLSPFVEIKRGLSGFPVGLRWLRHRPGYLTLLAVPTALSLLSLVVIWGAFFHFDDQIMAWLLFSRPEGLGWLALYYAAKVVLYVSFLLISLVWAILIANVLACPVYEWVSVVVERDFLGGQVHEVGLWESLRLIGEELKKVLFILTMSLFILVIPGLNLIALPVTAFLVGWDFYDYPLARRGWGFGARLRFVIGDFWAVMGFGLWLMIPFLQALLMPLAVSGGSLLALQNLQRQQMLSTMRVS